MGGCASFPRTEDAVTDLEEFGSESNSKMASYEGRSAWPRTEAIFQSKHCWHKFCYECYKCILEEIFNEPVPCPAWYNCRGWFKSKCDFTVIQKPVPDSGSSNLEGVCRQRQGFKKPVHKYQDSGSSNSDGVCRQRQEFKVESELAKRFKELTLKDKDYECSETSLRERKKLVDNTDIIAADQKHSLYMLPPLGSNTQDCTCDGLYCDEKNIVRKLECNHKLCYTCLQRLRKDSEKYICPVKNCRRQSTIAELTESGGKHSAEAQSSGLSKDDSDKGLGFPAPKLPILSERLDVESIKLTWKKPEIKDQGCTLSSYIVEEKLKDGTINFLKSVPALQTFCILENLNAEKTYTFCICALYNQSNKSPVVTMEKIDMKIFKGGPSKPVGPLLTSESDDRIHLKWSAPLYSGGSPIKHYRLQKWDFSINKWIQHRIIGADKLECFIEKSGRLDRYLFQIIAENGFERKSPPLKMETVMEIKKNDPPNTPDGPLVIKELNDRSFNVSWPPLNLKEDDGIDYLILYVTVETYNKPCKTYISPKETLVNVNEKDGLERNKHFLFSLTAVSKFGKESHPRYASSTFCITDKPLAPKGSLKVIKTKTDFLVTWEHSESKVDDEKEEYITYICNLSSNLDNVVGRINSQKMMTTIPKEKFKSSCRIKVTFRNKFGEESPPLCSDPPKPPRGPLCSTEKEDGSIAISWSGFSEEEIPDIENLCLYLTDKNGDMICSKIISGNSKEFIITNLELNRTYTATLVSINRLMEESKPICTKFTTHLKDEPLPPKGPLQVIKTETDLTVIWDHSESKEFDEKEEYITYMCDVSTNNVDVVGRVSSRETIYTIPREIIKSSCRIKVTFKNKFGEESPPLCSDPPKPPRGPLCAIEKEDGSVTISWSDFNENERTDINNLCLYLSQEHGDRICSKIISRKSKEHIITNLEMNRKYFANLVTINKLMEESEPICTNFTTRFKAEQSSDGKSIYRETKKDEDLQALPSGCDNHSCRNQNADFELSCGHKFCDGCQSEIKIKKRKMDNITHRLQYGCLSCQKYSEVKMERKYTVPYYKRKCDYPECQSAKDVGLTLACNHGICTGCYGFMERITKDEGDKTFCLCPVEQCSCLTEVNYESRKGVVDIQRIMRPRTDTVKDYLKTPEVLGIPNIGLTCYANSIFQVLGQTPKLKEHLDTYLGNSKETNYKKDRSLAMMLLRILRSISESTDWSKRNKQVSELMETIFEMDKSFARYMQNDCHSFLMCLFNGIKEEEEKVETKGITEKRTKVVNMFEGSMSNYFEFSTCHHKEVSEQQSFTSLLIPIPNEKESPWSVKRGLDLLMNKEEFRDNQLPCRECEKVGKIDKKTVTTKTLAIVKAPEVLILQLGRFREEEGFCDRRRLQKVHSAVGYEKEIPLQVGKAKKKYRLYGVVLHDGSLSGGHYYSYVKAKNEKWYHCSDSYVREINDTIVLGEKGAYMLFYTLTFE